MKKEMLQVVRNVVKEEVSTERGLYDTYFPKKEREEKVYGGKYERSNVLCSDSLRWILNLDSISSISIDW